MIHHCCNGVPSPPRDPANLPRILINAGEGKAPIDIMRIFCLDPDDQLAKMGDTLKEIVLPPDVYPPEWDKRDLVTDEIIRQALLQTGSQLIKETTKPKWTKSGERSQLLRCKYGRTFYDSTFGGQKRTNQEVYNNHTVDGPSVYKHGIRQDRIVNKGKASRGPEGKKMVRRSETEKPCSEDKCPFQIKVTLKRDQHFVLKTTTWDYAKHNHIMVPISEMVISTKRLSPTEKENIEVLCRYAGNGSARNIFHHTSDFNLSPQQLDYVSKRNDCHPNASNATKLMSHLREEVEKKTIRYIALYHQVKDTSLLAISKAQKKKELEEIRERLARRPMEGRPGELRETELELRKIQDSPELSAAEFSLDVSAKDSSGETKDTFKIDSTLDKLALGAALSSFRGKLSVGQKVLLAVAWCHEDERHLFELFPEVLMFDVTYQTNNEGRPLGVTCSPDGNMDVFSPIRAFLPSECKWVFSWFFGTAIPTLLGTEPLKRTQLVLSDGDSKIYNAFEAHRDRFYPQAVHGLCMYHLVNKGLEKLKSNLIGLDEKEVKDLLMHFRAWIFSWTRVGGVETEDEFQISKKLCFAWLKDVSTDEKGSRAMKHNAVILSDHLEKYILHHKERWFLPGREGRMTLDQKTTSALEGLNHTIKCKSSKNVAPNMTLLQSFRTQYDQVKSWMTQWFRNTWRYHKRTSLCVSGSPTASKVNMRCESQVQKNMEQAQYYACRPLTSLEIQVVRLPGTAPAFCQDCTGSEVCGSCNTGSPVAKFARRRKITFTPLPGDSFSVTCKDCLDFPTTGIPCRHFARLTKIEPEHVHIRWHRAYPALYKRDTCEKETEDFIRRQRDRRLIVSRAQYERMMKAAKDGEQMYPEEVFNQDIFANGDSHCFQNTPNGRVFHGSVHGSVPAQDNMGDEDHLLSQEVGLPDTGSESASEPGDRTPYLTGHTHNDLVAALTVMTGQANRNPQVKALLCNLFYEMQEKFHEGSSKILNTDVDFTGEYVSVCPQVGGGRRAVRIRSASEPQRQPGKKQRMAQTGLSTESIIN